MRIKVARIGRHVKAFVLAKQMVILI